MVSSIISFNKIRDTIDVTEISVLADNKILFWHCGITKA